MKKKLAFVLGGGGSRGALQAGALRALIEAGYKPEIVTGASIGAANGAFMAIHGFTLEGVAKLEEIWRSTVDKDMLPTDLWRQLMRTFFQRTRGFSQERIREFAIASGLDPSLRFKDLKGVAFYPVATDLNSGAAVVFGEDADQLVLESVLASMTLPPWLAPEEKDGRLLLDGGAVSNLPVEVALTHGATEIIALDLFDPDDVNMMTNRVGNFLLKLDRTIESRKTELEIQLAEAHGVPVRRIALTGETPVPLWDFRHSVELIERGYQLAQQAIASWPPRNRSSWRQRLDIRSIFD